MLTGAGLATSDFAPSVAATGFSAVVAEAGDRALAVALLTGGKSVISGIAGESPVWATAVVEAPFDAA